MNRRWEIRGPVAHKETLLITSLSSAFLNKVCSPFVTNKKRYGERGSPWRSPLSGTMRPWGCPFNTMEKETNLMQTIISLTHLVLNPILTWSSLRTPTPPNRTLSLSQVVEPCIPFSRFFLSSSSEVICELLKCCQWSIFLTWSHFEYLWSA